MPRYLLSIYQPDGPPPATAALEKIMRDVEAVRREMQAAGALVFTAGLRPPATATVVKAKDGAFLLTDGPFAETKEHLGGFSIVQAPDPDTALEWGRKLAKATTLPIEIRPLHDDEH